VSHVTIWKRRGRPGPDRPPARRRRVRRRERSWCHV